MRRGGWKCGGVFDLVRRHRDYDPRLHRKVLGQDRRLVENCATTESRQLYEMQRAVMRCLHLKKGFLRLKSSEHGILWADARLEHDVADLLLAHFSRRYPTFHIALGHRGRTYVAYPGGMTNTVEGPVEETVRRLELTLPKMQHMDGCRVDAVWKRYYDSQQITQRQDLKLMSKMMPKKYRDEDAYETKAAGQSRNLIDYA